MLTKTKFILFRLQLRDLTLVGQTNNKERNKQKEKTNPTKSKNKSHKNKSHKQKCLLLFIP